MHLTKHHGLGNDFLVLLGDVEPSAALARRLCDRRRGIGADGLLVGKPATEAGVDAVMALRNADGSRAEMSGNGIRCLAHALLRVRDVRSGAVQIRTDAGLRRVVVEPGPDPSTCLATVDMGPVRPGPPWRAALPEGLQGQLGTDTVRLETADLGNPHVVVQTRDPTAVDLARFGRALDGLVPGGSNVEFVAATEGRRDEIDLTVWERGAGITQACGTGACAGAWAAHRWGLVGRDVVVHLPGGDVRVHLDGTATLIGPATYVADVDVELAALGDLAAVAGRGERPIRDWDRSATAGTDTSRAAVGGRFGERGHDEGRSSGAIVALDGEDGHG